ncbi:amino acid adenylation protein [Citrobacter amalonaticus]|uniref:Amino acid adenylation protein n=1 Tax=Citrobacter amalonaticus TaxID=35703 RepID=A0A2S4S072_CITAM|nr:amino acid adenylation domain-containing protein [Citrobacter amalonaticus]POT58307.1 amino acid adenylation protein [Citrobacter amalonaticus]POT76168.1 amino acid adenylation protein [Citrobacter amalonaticus]POU66834.1 amino acid adenylation protein [Citrobacter amalonaticus]POV05403.1 amino acid adenylation protein [Citrobacter amalonaticus]
MKSLTPMQAASWVGRQSAQALGGVAAHLYAEFDGFMIDSLRFQHAVSALCALHPMLRLHVNDDGQQRVMKDYPQAGVDDFRQYTADEINTRLAEKRHRMENQQVLRDQGYPCEFSLSLLPDGKSRLHIDIDMIAADAESFRIVVEDLARFYETPSLTPSPEMKVEWFDYLNQHIHDRQLLKLRTRDRLWWQSRLSTLPPAPRIPSTEKPCQSRRMAVLLDGETSKALNICARQHHLTLSALFLSLFTLAISKGLSQPSLRINVPTFFRDPTVPNVRKIVGDFSDLLLFSGELRPEISLLQHAERTMTQLHELISHGNYSGISIMRDLSRLNGNLQYSPIVFTAGFGIHGGSLFTQRVKKQLGALTWVISQGPQVALDAQVAWYEDEILINWDVRADAFMPGQLTGMFTCFHSLTRRLAQFPQDIHHPVSQWLSHRTQVKHDAIPGEERMARSLSPLQLAYLSGRSEHWPLGGVAMHDFRTFRGRLDPQRFCRRVAELVNHFAALRTVIDVEKQQQFVLPTLEPRLEQVDLTSYSTGDAEQQIEHLKHRYQQMCHDPSLPPWKIILIALPGGSEYLVFTSFDALILDGQGISRITARLFDEQPLDARAARPPTTESLEHATTREEAKNWWREKLHGAVTPSRLPWLTPLGEIARPEWRRESRNVEAGTLKKLSRLGASHGLFSNTVLSTLVLDTLALWADDETVLVGVPTAFPSHEEQPFNQSTFIVIRYQREGELEENAQRLQADILNGLQHLAWSGVDLARQLSPRNASQPALPIILTNCMAWETVSDNGSVQEEDGLTQTPQVALDIRLMPDGKGGLLLVADYVEQALGAELIRAVLDAIVRRMQQIAARGVLNTPVREALSYPHYQVNADVPAATEYDFLRNIAHHLYSGEREGTALICGNRRWSWKQLGEQVASVANGLAERQLTPGSVVAIYLPRSPEHIIISLACALTGLIRVPLDINSPPERTRYLLNNCRPDLVISLENTGIAGSVTPQALASTNDSPPPLVSQSASDLPSYYLYTSGTTGKPKCVVLNNRATANVLGQTINHWQIGERDVFISVTPLHHDMSVFDLFAAMSVGATLVIPAEQQEKDAIAWSRLVEQHRVTLWCSVPAILEMLLDCAEPEQLRSLRLIAQGGDYIKPSTIQRLRAVESSPRLVSLGGPTETTIWSIWHEIVPEDIAQIPYGQPLAGNQYFICHDSGEHCPCGVAGRIHTAGINLACGYLEEARLVQHDFVDLITPEGEKIRAFRTGDIGFYRPDGTIMFSTRINGYVKIRGVRVSLPEIEDVLRQHPAIKDIVIIDYATEDFREKSLGAVYLVQGDITPGAAELRAFAQRYLPCTHIPGRFIVKKAFPLSTNGKIDRHALRAELAQTSPQSSPSPSATALICNAHSGREQKILEIYCAALKQPARPEWHEDVPFITMGLKLCHLKEIRENINAEFGINLSGQELIKCKNISDVCALLT